MLINSRSPSLAAPPTSRAVEALSITPTRWGNRLHPLRHAHLLSYRGVTQKAAEPISPAIT